MDILSIELKLSKVAGEVIQLINELKETDPIAAGRLYQRFDKFVRENAPTTTVFSIGELEKYGYIPKP